VRLAGRPVQADAPGDKGKRLSPAALGWATIAPVSAFDPRVPSIARVYDYLLGGKDNFAADRELAGQLVAHDADVPATVRENRQFLASAVTWVAQQGVGQFIDVGCGLPTVPNTHQTARAVNPDARVAYIDNDPVVYNHLMTFLGKEPGVEIVSADIRDVDGILRTISRQIDFSVPACVIMGSLLHFFPTDVARDLVSRYLAPLAPGSYLVVSIGKPRAEASDHAVQAYSEGVSRFYSYSDKEIASLFSLPSLGLIAPGITQARAWRAGWTELPAIKPRTGEMMVGVASKRSA
jgi:hypothetical protein